MLGSKKNENICSVCNGTGLRSKKIKKTYLNPVDLCSNCGGVGGIRSNEGISKSKGLSKKAVVGLSVLGALSVGAVAFFLTRKKDEATQPEATQPEATQPEATQLEATQPEATQPEATQPEATQPEATQPEATQPEATQPEATQPEAIEPEDTPPVALPPGFKPSEIISLLGVEMFLLPPGRFISRIPRKIEKPFLLGKTEVTQELYIHVMGKNPSKFKNPKNPVETVSWFDCIAFCNELSELEGLDKCYIKLPSGEWSCDFDKNGYRLPTSDEWVYAAKAGTKNDWAGTDNEKDLKNYAWYRYGPNSGNKTHPVGTRLPNEWGFYDMAGNVWEWCWDLNGLTSRIVHGGSFDDDVDFCRTSQVDWFEVNRRDGDLGFRLCRSAV